VLDPDPKAKGDAVYRGLVEALWLSAGLKIAGDIGTGSDPTSLVAFENQLIIVM
jgi:hypothetical protein